MVRGPKKHLKRLNAPKSWMLDKLTGVFAPKPAPGASSLFRFFSRSFFLRVKMWGRRALRGEDGCVRAETIELSTQRVYLSFDCSIARVALPSRRVPLYAEPHFALRRKKIPLRGWWFLRGKKSRERDGWGLRDAFRTSRFARWCVSFARMSRVETLESFGTLFETRLQIALFSSRL